MGLSAVNTTFNYLNTVFVTNKLHPQATHTGEHLGVR